MTAYTPRGRHASVATTRADLLRDRDALIAYLREHDGDSTTADACKALGFSPCRPGQLAGQFPMSLSIYKDYTKNKTHVELHPHLMLEAVS